jgi:hypothetical protein
MGRSAQSSREHIERMLDEALEGSFPASDPTSIAMPQRLMKGEGDNPPANLLNPAFRPY